MALSPELDAIAVQIAQLEDLISHLDGRQAPIVLSVGPAQLTVDPTANPGAYSSGQAVIHSVVDETVARLKATLVTVALAQSAATVP